ncbi:glucans biosynthesis glucosyltransferase MdoH [Ancylobacter sonchi]|uniref:glucans biosynthesis glucosyltransferase MdoH n=1 Tax=Ancylobacter sonchi TaxID=1937790 RepID=UPI001BD6771B|nr:glucans biosynthesis glucosyltransferase MdoH [Ancylobacter sonchi]MBS7533410.1 glucans biosynthesis glucosyltransferase MdoH [Ancylobacter sonchi]
MGLDETTAQGILATADPVEGRTPTGVQSLRQLRRRRVLVLMLNVGTYAGLVALFAYLLAHGGFTFLDGLLLLAFCLSTPWAILGFWNAVIGLWLLHGPGDARRSVYPYAGKAPDTAPIVTRVAVVMVLRNEDPERAFARLRAMYADLEPTGMGDHFRWFVLSDTTEADIALAEEVVFQAWRGELGLSARIHYRRRNDNVGFKAGNIRDFLDRWGDDHDLMLVLDADSFLGAASLLRMVRIMQANPMLGILQSLVVGMPAASPFARIFQFGMRHGMRSYTMGASWWAGDCGPYWGHNAVIRIAPFKAFCELPTLPGKGPLAGHVLSHDQIEAVLMRRAGYEVRVLPEETDSYEENPPHLAEFTRRDLRWCQGNMQYWRLLAMPGLKPMSRIQIAWAILMYVGAFAWALFMILATLKVFDPESTDVPFPTGLGLTLFILTFLMSLAPKIAGLLDVLLRPGERQRYGGTGRLIGGALLEFLFSVLLGPVIAFRIAIFMVGIVFGRTVKWEAQARDAKRLSWRTAFGGLWPQLLSGVLIGGVLYAFAPLALIWAWPLLVSLLGAVPFAVLTSEQAVGRRLSWWGLCSTPEEVLPTSSLVLLDAQRYAFAMGGPPKNLAP